MSYEIAYFRILRKICSKYRITEEDLGRLKIEEETKERVLRDMISSGIIHREGDEYILQIDGESIKKIVEKAERVLEKYRPKKSERRKRRYRGE